MIDRIKWVDNGQRISLTLRILQVVPFNPEGGQTTIILGYIERPGNYYRCFTFGETWKEQDLHKAKFDLLKFARWIAREIAGAMDFGGLVHDPDLWEFCK